MTSPRYASRPTYASSGRSRRNFASSSFHVAAPAVGAPGGPAAAAPCPPEAPAASAPPLVAPEAEPVLVELEPCSSGAPWELGPPLVRCPLWMREVPTWDTAPRVGASAVGWSPSEGCSAPGTSRTRRGRYHPSVHGFILHCTQNKERAAANQHARMSLSAIRWTHSVRREEKFRRAAYTTPGHTSPQSPAQRTVRRCAGASVGWASRGEGIVPALHAEGKYAQGSKRNTTHLPPQRCWRGGSCSGAPEGARRRGTKNGRSLALRHLAVWK